MAFGAVAFNDVDVISESVAPVAGFVNGCGQAAVLMMAHLQTGQKVDANTLLNWIKFGIATGNATTSGRHAGATNAAQLQWLADQQGIRTRIGSGANWQRDIDAALNSGRIPVLGVSNAKAFGGADANVSGHWVTIVGRTQDGRYIVADPNQQAAKNGGTVVYTAKQIHQARPMATLVPVEAAEAAANGAASGAAGNALYSINAFGQTISLDPLVDFMVRASLVSIGVALVIIAILIFTRKDIARGAELAAVAA